MSRVEVSLESVFREPILADQAILLEDLILSKIEGLNEAATVKLWNCPERIGP